MVDMSDPDGGTLQERVWAARKRLGMTQAQVAKQAKVGLRTYQHFEKGQQRPQSGNLRAILAVLGIDETGIDVAPEPADEAWPGDIAVFLAQLGDFLMNLTPTERLVFIREETRRIFVDRQTPVYAMMREAREAREAELASERKSDTPKRGGSVTSA